MTKILSKLLNASEPSFRLGVMELERASGMQGHDIRLTSELLTTTRTKLAELRLDPGDTTAEELYASLLQKIEQSDKELAQVLKLNPLEPDFIDNFAASISQRAGRSCYALKSSAAKKLFKANPPKRAMKALGYRSLESYLKHESLAGILTSARICEHASWQKAYQAEFKRLTPSDFEDRKLNVTALTSQRWQALAKSYVGSTGNNAIGFSVAGTLAILPFENIRSGMLTAMFLLALGETNEALATGSYLRMNQFQADFGHKVQIAANGRLAVTSPIAGQNLSWRVVHEFLASDTSDLELPLAEERTGLPDPVDALASLSPALGFWRGTSHLAYHASDGEIVSLNPLDMALNYINRLPFDTRVSHHFRQNLWRQFWQTYLQADVLAEKLMASLRQELGGMELAPEFALDEGVLAQ